MRIKLLFALFFLLTYINPVLSQQDKILTHFMYDKMSINPGSTGMGGGICATMIYRNQWDKVTRAPNSTIFNIEGSAPYYFPGGVGISFYNDGIGFMTQNSAILNYSYPLALPGYGTLGIGLGIGILNYGLNPDWHPPVTTNDPSLLNPWSATGLDMNFGLYWQGDQDYYAGISSTHLTETEIADKGAAVNDYPVKRHYYLMGGKTFNDIGGSNGDLYADLVVRTDFVKTSLNISARYLYDNMIEGGISYRTSDMLGIMLGYIPLPNMKVGYAYDVTLNTFTGISKGSHELFVKYCYYLPPPPIQKSKHPRWL